MELSIEYIFMANRSEAVWWYVINSEHDPDNMDIDRARELFRQECPGVPFTWIRDVGLQDTPVPIEIDDDDSDETVLFTKNDSRMNDFDSVEMTGSKHNISGLSEVMDMTVDYDLELIPVTPDPVMGSLTQRRHSY